MADDKKLTVVPGGRTTTEPRAGRRAALDQCEQVTCWRCEHEIGIATSMVVKVKQAPRRKPDGRITAGTDAWVCAHCLGRGRFTEMVRP